MEGVERAWRGCRERGGGAESVEGVQSGPAGHEGSIGTLEESELSELGVTWCDLVS